MDVLTEVLTSYTSVTTNMDLLADFSATTVLRA